MRAKILNASAWMIVPVMDAFAKHLSASMDVFQIVWARYFFSALFTLSLMLIFPNYFNFIAIIFSPSNMYFLLFCYVKQIKEI